MKPSNPPAVPPKQEEKMQTATVTLKKGSEILNRDLYDECGIKVGNPYVIGGEEWVVDKIHGKEPEEKKPEPKAEPKAEHKPASAKHHAKPSHRR